MYNRQFFSTQLGKVSALCITAMVAFSLITMTGQISGTAQIAGSPSPTSSQIMSVKVA